MKDAKLGYYGYTEIYNSIFVSLRSDLVEEKTAIVTAKRLTDAIWDLHLVLNTGEHSLSNTVGNVKNILENRIKL
jgi:hypothetical protein